MQRRLALPVAGMTTSFDMSQELFSINILTALKYSSKDRRKHVLRSFRLYGDQA